MYGNSQEERNVDAMADLSAVGISVVGAELMGAAGESVGRAIITFGGITALAVPVLNLSYPRLLQLIAAKEPKYANALVIRGALSFVIAYGLLVLAGAPELKIAALTAGSVMGSDYIYGWLQSRESGTGKGKGKGSY